jgi:hypothetical protein
MHEAEDAMESADWIGVNCSWTNMSEMISKHGRGKVVAYRKAFPHKLLFVTEFNNPSLTVKPEVKAQQYLSFRRQIGSVPGVGAIFSYAMSSTDDNSSLAWTPDAVHIADVLGRRVS